MMQVHLFIDHLSYHNPTKEGEKPAGYIDYPISRFDNSNPCVQLQYSNKHLSYMYV